MKENYRLNRASEPTKFTFFLTWAYKERSRMEQDTKYLSVESNLDQIRWVVYRVKQRQRIDLKIGEQGQNSTKFGLNRAISDKFAAADNCIS